MCHRKYLINLSLIFILAVLSYPVSSSYVSDLTFLTSQTIYTIGERIELSGYIYLSNFSSDGTVLMNHTAIENATINISIIRQGANASSASYLLNTTSSGYFYSQNDFYTTATLISAPNATGTYYIKAIYIDPNSSKWFTQNEIQVVNNSLDKLLISSDKATYSSGEQMLITIEAVKEIGDQIVYVANFSANGSIRDVNKAVQTSFSCTTGSNGKCTVSATAPTTYGDYYLEANNFKSFSSFSVIRFDVNVKMKDELGKSIKYTFNKGEQASVEVNVITSSQSESYTFVGIVKTTSGTIVKTIDSTIMNSTNSYTNRFTFTLDAVNFQTGTYLVDINITKTGDGIVQASTSFQVRSWDINVKKRDVSSGFQYDYSIFQNNKFYLEIYPTWRTNGSVIDSINATTSINIFMLDKFNNQIATANPVFNSSCGKEGCYEFFLTSPNSTGAFYISVIISHDSDAQTFKRKFNVIDTTIYAQSTDKEGTLKDLFGTNEFVYISLDSKNSSASINLSSAEVVSVVYMNGSESIYVSVNGFDNVNASNSVLEWAWNGTLQRLKLDAPANGGVYNIQLSGNNNTAATSTRFIINPYEACAVAKNTPGQVSSGYYYVYQYKTTDTIYFELKLRQANNPTGRATSLNASGNSSYGMGSACTVNTQTQQVVNNATITVEEVINILTGKSFSLNSSETRCQSDDSSGGYSCSIKPVGSWDGGSYGIKFKIIGSDKQTSDIAYAGFDARSFYLYAWSTNWQNKPSSNIALNIYMYEAGTSWWGNVGSGGLSGTVTLEKIEYQGAEGEWLSTPIAYGYNVSKINASTITNGQGSMTLNVNHTTAGKWKTGNYRAILKGTDNGGNTDYGYAWFGIKRWQTYASPVDCSGLSCNSVYNLNSKSNISLYITINNAGEWGQSGNSLGGDVTITVKKIMDCRRWPCSELNSSKYTSTNVIVSASSGWYWSGNINKSYLLNITPTAGTWNSGYWQVVLDVNNTETGTGWFNTIAFYVETKPTDITGTNWKYNIKNAEPMFFYVTTVKSQKSGYYYSNYNTSDYVNATIDSVVLRKWDSATGQSIEYVYPNQLNVGIVGGGTLINGTRVINVTLTNGSWTSGYYNGEMTLRNTENETANSYLWFQVKPFRVQISSNQYSIDNDVCINGSLYIYDPDWTSNSILIGNYTIQAVTETTWSSSGSSMTTYTNFTPSSAFNGSGTFRICPNGNKWGSGSWGNYHYLTVRIANNQSSTEDGWLSFRTVPFSISWGSIVGGTNVIRSANVQAPITLTKASSGASAAGRLLKVYQWRYDNYASRREDYSFSVGSCDTRNAGTTSCIVNGTRNVTLYAPTDGWKDGYNYLQAEWSEYDDSSSIVQDYSGVWFNGKGAYSGWFSYSDENGNYKYYFSPSENITIRLYVQDSSGNYASANVSKVEYSTPSTTCWADNCRTYNTVDYLVAGQPTARNMTANAVIKIIKPSSDWSNGYIYIRATVTGNGTEVIKNGYVQVKDLTSPKVTVTSPPYGQLINTSSFWINWTTTESANCYLYVLNYNTYFSWYCWNGNGSSSYCVNSSYSGSSYVYDYISKDYRSWSVGNSWGWSSSSTGLSTGGTSHYYQYSASQLSIPNQSYGISISCSDSDWNYAYNYTAFKLNYSGSGSSGGGSGGGSNGSSSQNATNVTLLSPANGASVNNGTVEFNYTLTGPSSANCSLFANFTGSWLANITSNAISNGTNRFRKNITDVAVYKWNVYCVDATNGSNSAWGASNRTVVINSSVSNGTPSSVNQTVVTLVSPANFSSVNTADVILNYSFVGPAQANCTLYGNFTGSWLANISGNVSSGSNFFNKTLGNGSYFWNVYCVDAANSSNYDWGNSNWTFNINTSNASIVSQSVIFNVTLISPLNGVSINLSTVIFNYTLNISGSANCSLWGNPAGNWTLNVTQTNQTAGNYVFNQSWINGSFLWNVKCVNFTNGGNIVWAPSNWSFQNNYTGG